MSKQQPFSMINNPLICVAGCTGTGKSDLGIAIAREFNGEVISADAMQIYNALDIATNKVSEDESRGVPHHLIGHCAPTLDSYTVHDFRSDALPIIERLWNEGKLPVIVGGTAYYLESLIYQHNLIDTVSTAPGRSDEIRANLLAKFSTNDELYDELMRVDPCSAAHVHRNNAFRVLRALEIFYATGRRKSDFIDEQCRHISDAGKSLGKLRFPRTFFINLDAEKGVLDERLYERIDRMIERGLVAELEDFYKTYGNQLGTHGIMQTIGLKEFLPFFNLPDDQRQTPRGSSLFAKCVDRMKINTRKYSRKQRRWIFQRILLRGKIREVPEFVSLDTSHDFSSSVVPLALECVRNFLTDRHPIVTEDNTLLMPLPSSLMTSADYTRDANRLFRCDVCAGVEVAGRMQWEKHLQGRQHRFLASASQKTASNDHASNK